MSGGEKNLGDEGIEALEDSEIQHLGALPIQIRHQFLTLTLRHLFLLDGFEDLDDAFFIIGGVNALRSKTSLYFPLPTFLTTS